MHLNGRAVASFDPEGLIFAAGIDSRQLKLYDLRSFDKVLPLIKLTEKTMILYCRVLFQLFMCVKTLLVVNGLD